MRSVTRRLKVLSVVAVASIAVTSCGSPSIEEEACLDYMEAVDEENEIKAADAVNRLADEFDESTMTDNGVVEIAETADLINRSVALGGMEPLSEALAVELYSACREAYG